MNKIYIILLLLLATSCGDSLLDLKDPNRLTSGNFYTTEERAIAAVNAAYSPLQKSGMYGRNVQYVSGWRSDEGRATSETVKMEENGAAVAQFTNNASDAMAAQMWRDMFNGVFRANVALKEIPNIEMDAALRGRLLGEAHFLRGIYYFHLVMFFGEEIPLHISPPQSIDENNKGAAEENAIWLQIIKDFTESQTLLANYTNSTGGYQKGRATLGAATGFLGKALLFHGQMKDEPASIDQAAIELKKVIDGKVGTYALMDNYRNNFTHDLEYNNEALFEVGFAYNPSMSAVGEWIVDQDNAGASETTFRAQGAGMHPSAGNRWWNEAPDVALKNEYETQADSVIDPRYYMTLWVEKGAWYMDNIAKKDSVKKFENVLWPDGYFGWRKYEYDYKHQIYDEDSPDFGSDINYRLMRYADVLLMYAECLILIGKEGEAASYIEQVRARARKQITDEFQASLGNDLWYTEKSAPLPTVAQLIADGSNNIISMTDALRHERMVELAGESIRYMDIIRWDIGNEVIKESGFRGVYLMPIPQTELDNNPTMRPNEAN